MPRRPSVLLGSIFIATAAQAQGVLTELKWADSGMSAVQGGVLRCDPGQDFQLSLQAEDASMQRVPLDMYAPEVESSEPTVARASVSSSAAHILNVRCAEDGEAWLTAETMGKRARLRVLVGSAKRRAGVGEGALATTGRSSAPQVQAAGVRAAAPVGGTPPVQVAQPPGGGSPRLQPPAAVQAEKHAKRMPHMANTEEPPRTAILRRTYHRGIPNYCSAGAQDACPRWNTIIPVQMGPVADAHAPSKPPFQTSQARPTLSWPASACLRPASIAARHERREDRYYLGPFATVTDVALETAGCPSGDHVVEVLTHGRDGEADTLFYLHARVECFRDDYENGVAITGPGCDTGTPEWSPTPGSPQAGMKLDYTLSRTASIPFDFGSRFTGPDGSVWESVGPPGAAVWGEVGLGGVHGQRPAGSVASCLKINGAASGATQLTALTPPLQLTAADCTPGTHEISFMAVFEPRQTPPCAICWPHMTFPQSPVSTSSTGYPPPLRVRVTE